MILQDLFETEHDHHHQRALDRTGFWGKQAAGCIFMAQDTKRFLLAHRSNRPPPYNVEQPGTWGIWGGAIDPKENPKTAALREAEEETGYSGQIKLVPLYVFEHRQGGAVVFKYHNFLAIVPTEFTPTLNWESQGSRWCDYGDWPSPLHFGVTAILNDGPSIGTMKAAAA